MTEEESNNIRVNDDLIIKQLYSIDYVMELGFYSDGCLMSDGCWYFFDELEIPTLETHPEYFL